MAHIQKVMRYFIKLKFKLGFNDYGRRPLIMYTFALAEYQQLLYCQKDLSL